jgi:ankyrin repeat protein
LIIRGGDAQAVWQRAEAYHSTSAKQMLQKVVYPLHEACSQNDLETMSSLLNTGPCTRTGLMAFDVDAKDFAGSTPLRIAITSGHLDVVCRLLAARCKINVTDWSIALEQLRRHEAHSQCARVMKVLQQHAYPMHFACAKGHVENVDRLLRQHLDVNATDWRGRTPLHEASKKGHSSVVHKLLSAGADLNAKDGNGFSACQLAVMWADVCGISTSRGNEQTFSLFQHAGASVMEEMRSYGNLRMQEGERYVQITRQEKEDEEKYMDCLGGWGGFVWGVTPELGTSDTQPRFAAQGSMSFSLLPTHATPLSLGARFGSEQEGRRTAQSTGTRRLPFRSCRRFPPVGLPRGTTQVTFPNHEDVGRGDSDASSSSASDVEDDDIEGENERLCRIWGRPDEDNYPEDPDFD